jgi:hypothetical protein
LADESLLANFGIESRHPDIGDLLPGIDRDLTAIFWG